MIKLNLSQKKILRLSILPYIKSWLAAVYRLSVVVVDGRAVLRPVYCICDNQFEGGSSWLAVSVGF